MDCCRIPDYVRIITEDESALMEKKGSTFEYKDVQVDFLAKESLDISLMALKSEVRFIVCRFNGSWPKGTRFLGDVLERAYGNLAWRGIEPDRIMAWYLCASNKESNQAFGVKVRPNALCFWTSDGEGISLWLDVRSGGLGLILNGAKLEVATVVQDSAENVNTFNFLTDFCKKMCDDPITPKNPVYGSNNWYYAYGNSSAKEILVDTDLLCSMTQGLSNRPYMVIDDCWQELARTVGSAQGRPYNRGNELFPDMRGLADEIKAKGVHPGIWMRPLKTAERFIDKNLLSMRDNRFLDPSLPDVLELVAEDIERMTGEWGYELLKYDFVTRDILGDYYPSHESIIKANDWSFRDRSKTSAQCVMDLYRTIFEHSNGANIIGCNVIGHLAAGYIHIHRSGDDTSGMYYDRSVKMGVNCLAFRLVQHKTFFDVDADCICITDRIPWDKNKELIKLYANSGTPFFTSVAPSIVDDEIRAELTKAFAMAAIQKEKMEPVDWMETITPEKYLVDGKEFDFKWMTEYGKEWIISR